MSLIVLPKVSFISNTNLLLVVPSDIKRLLPIAKYTSLSIVDLKKVSYALALFDIVVIKLVLVLVGFPK